MSNVRFTTILTEEESERLKKLTYAKRFGDNRSALIRHLIDKAWQEHEAGNDPR